MLFRNPKSNVGKILSFTSLHFNMLCCTTCRVIDALSVDRDDKVEKLGAGRARHVPLSHEVIGAINLIYTGHLWNDSRNPLGLGLKCIRGNCVQLVLLRQVLTPYKKRQGIGGCIIYRKVRRKSRAKASYQYFGGKSAFKFSVTVRSAQRNYVSQLAGLIIIMKVYH